MNKIVIKIGTSTLTHAATGEINLRKVQALASVIADIQNSGRQVIIVTSGAVGVGKTGISFADGVLSTTQKQAAAAIGQVELMNIYRETFAVHNKSVAQLLLTRDVVDNPEANKNAKNTLEVLLWEKVIPIINENDTVSTNEIEFGDNDTLSAYVAKLAGADLLVVLTDIDGLYDANPAKVDNAKLIPVVEKITPEIYEIAGDAGSKNATGGMATKIAAAEIATGAGIDMVIASGEEPGILYDIMDGKSVGTLFRKG